MCHSVTFLFCRYELLYWRHWNVTLDQLSQCHAVELEGSSFKKYQLSVLKCFYLCLIQYPNIFKPLMQLKWNHKVKSVVNTQATFMQCCQTNIYFSKSTTSDFYIFRMNAFKNTIFWLKNIVLCWVGNRADL